MAGVSFYNLPAVSAANLLLDDYPNAAAAYSLRLLRKTYSGSAIRVRRASDNAEQDIGFTANNLDTPALISFCTGTNGFVTTWYDQSGNARNATQTTAASQPKIYDSVTGVILENYKPGIDFNSTSQFLTLTRISYSGISMFSVAKTKTAPIGNAQIFFQFQGVILKSGQNPTNYPRFQPYDTAYRTAEYQVNKANQQILIAGIISSGNANIYVNSLAGTTAAVGTLANPNNTMYIGRADIVDTGNNGPIQEFIFYISDQSANRTAIETNINNYYNIYP